MTKIANRYHSLDLLRGALAIAVVVHHLALSKAIPLFGKAWISVDIFFILSGFILSTLYAEKIKQGMGLKAFMSVRLMRLYPAFLLSSMVLLLVLITFRHVYFDTGKTSADLFGAFLMNLALIPNFNSGMWPSGDHLISNSIFPMNDPVWSLFFELLVNVSFFLYLRLRSDVALFPVLLVSLVGLIVCSIYLPGGLHGGWRGDNFLTGIFRVHFFFFLGVLMDRMIRVRQSFQWHRILAWFLVLLILLFQIKRDSVSYVVLFAMAPGLIVLSVVTSIPDSWNSLCRFLGDLSYPLYISHFAMFNVYAWAFGNLPPALYIVCGLFSSLLLAYAIHWGEGHLRRYLAWRKATAVSADRSC